MIARLRHRHRHMVGWVGALAIAGFAVALAARPPRPVVPAEPEAAPLDTSSWSELGGGHGIRALRQRRGGRQMISLRRPPGLPSPDLLVYWAPEGAAGSALPTEAVLLGPLGEPGSHRFELPGAAPAGSLVVYSLGHDRILESTELDSIRLADPGTGVTP